MTRKMTKSKSYHDTVDAAILAEIDKVGVIRRKELVDVLIGKFSISTINRRIAYLLFTKEISSITPEKAEIIDKDKRAKYLVLGTGEKRNELTSIEEVKDLLSDLLLIGEMYSRGYPFDDDHKAKHRLIFHYAHKLLGTTTKDILERSGIPLDKASPAVQHIIQEEQILDRHLRW